MNDWFDDFLEGDDTSDSIQTTEKPKKTPIGKKKVLPKKKKESKDVETIDVDAVPAKNKVEILGKMYKDVTEESYTPKVFDLKTDFSINRLRQMVHGKVDSLVFGLYVHEHVLRILKDIKPKGVDLSVFGSTTGTIKNISKVQNNSLSFEIVDDRIPKTVIKKVVSLSQEWLDYVNTEWVDEEIIKAPEKKRISILDVGN